MKLTAVEKSNHCLSIRRLNLSCAADIKSNINIWLLSLLFFGVIYLLSVALNELLKWSGSTPINLFMRPRKLLLLIPLSAVVIALGNKIDGSLMSSQIFTFDQDENSFRVDGRFVSHLDKISVRLQDGFGPSRRAFRLIVTEWGKDYVIAQTQRYTTAIFSGKEYSYIAVDEGRQQKYQFRRWADYVGAKTGFSPKWPDYQEIFALHTELMQFVKAAKNKPQTERQR